MPIQTDPQPEEDDGKKSTQHLGLIAKELESASFKMEGEVYLFKLYRMKVI